MHQGSLPERDRDKLYNTCPVFNSSGSLVSKHRKIHLFDVDVPGKITFRESEALSPGNSLTTIDTGINNIIQMCCMKFSCRLVQGGNWNMLRCKFSRTSSTLC